MTKKKTSRKPSPASMALAALKHNAKQVATKRPRGKQKAGTLGTNFTEERRQRYLDELQEHGEPALARREVGITAEAVRQHRKKTKGFAEAEEEAMRVYRAGLALEIHRRGVEGVQEPIYWQGMVVGWVTKYSDRLLELHAKRHIPEYRDKFTVTNEHSGTIGLLSDLSGLPADVRRDLKKVLKKVAEHQDDGE